MWPENLFSSGHFFDEIKRLNAFVVIFERSSCAMNYNESYQNKLILFDHFKLELESNGTKFANYIQRVDSFGHILIK